MTPVANNGNNIRLQTPESELEGKNFYIFFLYYSKVTAVANLELRISPRIFEKIRNGLTGLLWGWGATDS
jgi:hypothetical protein